MSGHRHAASALYGVSSPDQEAVLGALPAADQRILRAHLLELRALGFDPAAMRSAQAAIATGPSPMPSAAPPASALARLRLADPATMSDVLAQEPDGLVADVLALDAWPWLAPVLANLPPARRIALRLLNERPAPGPALRDLLLSGLDRMVAAAGTARAPAHLQDPIPDIAAVPARPGLRRTLSERWATWTR